MSKKLFASLADGDDFERKLIKRGVTQEAFMIAKNNAVVLDEIAQAITGVTALVSDGWIMDMLDAERAAHLAFFGQEFDLTPMREIVKYYGYAKIAEWRKLGLEVHFLPSITFVPDAPFDGWKIQPGSWYWAQVKEGNIYRRSNDGTLVRVSGDILPGNVVLIDIRKNPRHNEGRQMFANDRDFMGRVIERLRKNGELSPNPHGLQASRFSISSVDWEDHLKEAVARRLDLEPNQVRLEMSIEANIIPQLYTSMPRGDNTAGTWCWCEEFYLDYSRRLLSSGINCCGRMNVSFDHSGIHSDNSAIRPLGVLA